MKKINQTNVEKGFARFYFGAILAVFLAYPAFARSASSEYKLKAVFLCNFVQFVEWPTNAFRDEKQPIVIGVLGTDPFGKILEKAVQNETVRKRKIEVRRYKTTDGITNCHVLFISSSETPKMESVLSNLKGRGILTVSDSDPSAVKPNAMICFLKEKNKIRFRINVESAKEEHLSISSKLLQLADIVSDNKDP